MPDRPAAAAADATAVRVALWRALHVQVDSPPHVLADEIGLRLVAPDDGWRRRPDMDPDATRRSRASTRAWPDRRPRMAADGFPLPWNPGYIRYGDTPCVTTTGDVSTRRVRCEVWDQSRERASDVSRPA